MRPPVIIWTVLLLASCSKQLDPGYVAELEQWKTIRLQKLVGPEGYANLAGLFWLSDGATSFGDSASDIRFPERLVDQRLGVFQVNGNTVTLQPDEAAEILSGDQVLDSAALAYHDSLAGPPEFRYKSLRWKVISRGDQVGVRLRDLEHPFLKTMDPIEYFETDPSFRVEADFEPYDPPKMVMTANVLGMNYLARVPGILHFTLDGRSFSMEPNIDGEYLHLRFTDETTGEETYGLGRYLHAEMPDAENKVILDFNRAYNPPCAFTEFATCPIPPKQNHIPFKVNAGELSYGELH